METFGEYSGAPSELRDLTREFTIFWLSQASLQKTRRCYSCVLLFIAYRVMNMATNTTVLIYIYLPLVQNHSTDSLLNINWRAGAKLIQHASQYIFMTLNASAIKKTS